MSETRIDELLNVIAQQNAEIERLGGDPVEIPEREQVWRWEYDGDSWTMEDYTLEELEELEKLFDLPSYLLVMPRIKASHAKALLAVRLRRTKEEPEVAEILKRFTKGDLDKMVSRVDGDGLPDEWQDTRPLPSTRTDSPSEGSGSSTT